MANAGVDTQERDAGERCLRHEKGGFGSSLAKGRLNGKCRLWKRHGEKNRKGMMLQPYIKCHRRIVKIEIEKITI